ncbi:unnamed protein product [Musa textilis]
MTGSKPARPLAPTSPPVPARSAKRLGLSPSLRAHPRGPGRARRRPGRPRGWSCCRRRSSAGPGCGLRRCHRGRRTRRRPPRDHRGPSRRFRCRSGRSPG